MMKYNKKLRKRILDEPSYWIEDVNISLYDAIVKFKKKNSLKQKDIAKKLNLSEGRLSQIMNDGDINFTIEKLIKMVIAVGKYPSIELKDQEEFLRKEELSHNLSSMLFELSKQISIDLSEFSKHEAERSPNKKVRIIRLNKEINNELALAL